MASTVRCRTFNTLEPCCGATTSDTSRPLTWIDAVRVVRGDVRDQAMETMGRPAVYDPAGQVAFSTMYFAVRSEQDPAALIPAVRGAIRELDSELPLDAVGTVDALVSTALSLIFFSSASQCAAS